MTWGIQYKYLSNAVLLVFASHYDEAEDYIEFQGSGLGAWNALTEPWETSV